MHLVFKVQEVCKILRIHRPKVYELIEEGVLEGFKLGADWRITRQSLEKLLGIQPMHGDLLDPKTLTENSKNDPFLEEASPEKAA